MIRLTSVSFALAFALATAGLACGGKTCPPAAPTTSTDPAVARMIEHEQTSCACTTLACAGAARTDFEKWADANQDALKLAIGDTTRELQLDVHRGRADACRQKLFDAATPEERKAAGNDLDRAIDQLRELSDRVCACKDQACAEKVFQEVSRIEEPSEKPSEEQMAQVMKIAERMAECQRKLLVEDDGSSPTP